MRKALIIGSGAREHTIAKVLKGMGVEASVLPGNAGIAREFLCHPVSPLDFEGIAKVMEGMPQALVIFGNAEPIVAGGADYLRNHGYVVFGPGKNGAVLEGSKAFAKNFMRSHSIPTPDFTVCKTEDECKAALQNFEAPYVVKADGLAEGKGLYIENTADEALGRCREFLGGSLGNAGKTIVIEKFIKGRELSYFVLFDGINHLVLPSVQVYKKLLDDDKGPKTGGMGSFTPVYWETDEVKKRIRTEIIKPTLSGIIAEKLDYIGVIAIGVLVDEAGKPHVLEYNVKFGCPETQSLLPSYLTDWYSLMFSCATKSLSTEESLSLSAVSVVLASKDYPEKTSNKTSIQGLDKINPNKLDIYFYEGFEKEEDTYFAASGRILSLTSVTMSLESSRFQIYESLKNLNFEGMQYRNDIAVDS